MEENRTHAWLLSALSEGNWTGAHARLNVGSLGWTAGTYRHCTHRLCAPWWHDLISGLLSRWDESPVSDPGNSHVLENMASSLKLHKAIKSIRTQYSMRWFCDRQIVAQMQEDVRGFRNSGGTSRELAAVVEGCLYGVGYEHLISAVKGSLLNR